MTLSAQREELALSEQSVAPTEQGLVSGDRVGAVLRFRGIPFSEDTSGENRFRKAGRAKSWSGVRSCRDWACMTPQVPDAIHRDRPFYTDYLFGRNYQTEMAEGDLSLNLWTPGADNERRPVLVWLHGGGFTTGAASRPREDGALMSERGDVVVVAPTHRLGIFGYACFEDGRLSTPNVGLWDIILALDWLKRNIIHFGGDPDNVTIMGESGGGMKVTALMAMPAAKGLFHRAISLGGTLCEGHIASALTLTEAMELTRKVVSTIGLGESELESVSAQTLIDAQVKTDTRPLIWRPVIDGISLLDHPDRVLARGEGADVPLLIGSSCYEADFLSQLSPVFKQETLTGFEPVIGAERMAILRPFYENTIGEASSASAFLTDFYFRIPAVRIAEAHASAGRPAFVYRFDWGQPRAPRMRPTHGAETTFVFGNLDTTGFTRGFDEADRLSKAVQNAFVAFMRSGVPSSDELPIWPTFEKAERKTMVLSDTSQVVIDPQSEKMTAWETAMAASTPTKKTELVDRFVDCGSVRLRYVEAGKGVPVILVHGFMVDLDYQWSESGVIDALCDNFRVIAYDNRGHGKSEKLHRAEDYGLEMVNDLFRLMDALEIEKAHVVGYSMGAMIVARSLTMKRERFLSATLGGSSGRVPFTQEERLRNANEAEAMRNHNITGQILRLWPSNAAPPSEKVLKETSDAALAGKDCVALAAVRQSMEDLVATTEDLARVDDTLLGIVGTEDPYLDNLLKLKAARPSFELVTIPGASHESAPSSELFKTTLKSFLKASRLGRTTCEG